MLIKPVDKAKPKCDTIRAAHLRHFERTFRAQTSPCANVHSASAACL